MSDDKLEPVESNPLLIELPTPEPVSAGKLIRKAREASGMHIATLSMALKVPVKKLEALEADDWAQLPDAVFVRALATSVCRHVKTDSTPILAALPQSAQARLIDEQTSKGLNQTFRAANDPKPNLLRLPMSMPMVIGALVLLLAATVIIFLPDMAKRQDVKKSEIVETVMPSPAVIAPSEVVSVPVVATPASAPSAAASAPTPPAVVVTAPVIAPVPTPMPMPSTSGAILRMTAKGQVWIEVKDSKGVVLVQRTLQPKEVVNVSGLPPLAVVVGRINEMQSVEVRGKSFSLSGLSPDNVARFEVK